MYGDPHRRRPPITSSDIEPGADFFRMNLSGADLIYVTLSHANLSDTNLSNAVFCPMSPLTGTPTAPARIFVGLTSLEPLGFISTPRTHNWQTLGFSIRFRMTRMSRQQTSLRRRTSPTPTFQMLTSRGPPSVMPISQTP